MNRRAYRDRQEASNAPTADVGSHGLRLTPAHAAMAGIVGYIALLAVAPVRVVAWPGPWAMTYVAASYSMYLLGAKLAAKGRPRQKPTIFKERLLGPVLVAALIGVVARIFDRYVIRGASLDQAVMERRSAIEAATSNPASVVAAVLVPLCFALPFIVGLRAKDERRRRRLQLLSLGLFFFPAADALLVGSRSIFLATGALFVLYLVHYQIIRFSLRSLLTGIGILGGVVALSTAVFTLRLEAMKMDALWSAQSSVYAFTVQPSDWILDSLRRAPPNTAGHRAAYAVLNTSQYFLHGLLEFGYLFDNFEGNHTLGRVMLNDYFKFVSWATGEGAGRAIASLAQPRVGVFTSFFGPLFVDFGYVGPLVMLMFGVAMGRLERITRQGRSLATPLYYYLLVVVIFFPAVNLVVVGQGLFAITSLGLLALVGESKLRMAGARRLRT